MTAGVPLPRHFSDVGWMTTIELMGLMEYVGNDELGRR